MNPQFTFFRILFSFYSWESLFCKNDLCWSPTSFVSFPGNKQGQVKSKQIWWPTGDNQAQSTVIFIRNDMLYGKINVRNPVNRHDERHASECISDLKNTIHISKDIIYRLECHDQSVASAGHVKQSRGCTTISPVCTTTPLQLTFHPILVLTWNLHKRWQPDKPILSTCRWCLKILSPI